MKKLFICIALILIYPTISAAFVIGGTNLGIFGYPSHDCTKPMKPVKPFSFSDQWEVDMYNSEVDLYNLELQSYISCVEEYIDNANNDIKRIKEKTQEALDEASN